MLAAAEKGAAAQQPPRELVAALKCTLATYADYSTDLTPMLLSLEQAAAAIVSATTEKLEMATTVVRFASFLRVPAAFVHSYILSLNTG